MPSTKVFKTPLTIQNTSLLFRKHIFVLLLLLFCVVFFLFNSIQDQAHGLIYVGLVFCPPIYSVPNRENFPKLLVKLGYFLGGISY